MARTVWPSVAPVGRAGQAQHILIGTYMSKAANVLAALRELVKDPRKLRYVRDADYEVRMQRYVAQQFGYDQGLPVIDLLDLFPDFSECVQPYSFLEGQATVPDIALLKGLARRIEHCKYLEIGSWRGESIANVASVAEECVSISLSREELRAMSLPEAFIQTHNFYSKAVPNIKYIEHDSHTFDFTSLGTHFDLIFIDGDHSREGVRKDTQSIFPILHDARSVIVWHDYGHSPETIRWDVLAGILEGCPPEHVKKLYHVSNTMCAVFINGDFPRKYATRFQMPNKVFDVQLTARKLT
jgi:predicted O-methyltransferase YrrM